MADPAIPEDPDALVCHCLGVTRAAIDAAIRDDGARSVDDLHHCTGAGGGCGTCRWDCETILRRHGIDP